MWKRGGRSSALDRAQALLSARRSGKGAAESAETPHAAVKTRRVAPHTQQLLSDLSDLSSVNSAAEHEDGIVDSVAKRIQERQGDSSKDVNPQRSIRRGGGGGGESRFLKKKKAPAVTNSSQSPTFSKSQMPESRHSHSSVRGLSMLESHSHKQSHVEVQEQTKQGPSPLQILTSDSGILPEPSASLSLKAPSPLSAQFSSEPSLKGKRLIKNKAAVPVDRSNITADSTMLSGGYKRAEASASMKTKSLRRVRGVSLESDEDKMRNLLLGDSDSAETSLSLKSSSTMRTAQKMLRKSSPKVAFPLTSVRPSSSSVIVLPHSSISSAQRGSPLKVIAHAHLNPSVLHPSPSPPLDSPSRAERRHSSLSSSIGREEVLSLEELFTGHPASEDSDDFKMNILMLDDLMPVTLGFTEETPRNEGEAKHSKHKVPVPASLNGHQQLSGLKEEEEQQQQDEEVVDYESDFETEPDYSASQVLEHLEGDGEEEKDVSEVREEALESHLKTEDDYSSRFSNTNCSSAAQTSNRSETSESPSRNRDSRSSVSHAGHYSSQQLRRSSLPSRVLKEAVVQTEPLAYALSS
ncbi:hypothetical protein LDENG_00240380, partial [Lucifuga dentata]